jgi:hypothetical protein
VQLFGEKHRKVQEKVRKTHSRWFAMQQQKNFASTPRRLETKLKFKMKKRPNCCTANEIMLLPEMHNYFYNEFSLQKQ